MAEIVHFLLLKAAVGHFIHMSSVFCSSCFFFFSNVFSQIQIMVNSFGTSRTDLALILSKYVILAVKGWPDIAACDKFKCTNNKIFIFQLFNDK